jgi:threonine dehydratase
VRNSGHDAVEAEAHAREYAGENGLTYVSPYNDSQIIGGQGTIGLELAEQLDSIDAVFVALNGGGRTPDRLHEAARPSCREECGHCAMRR